MNLALDLEAFLKRVHGVFEEFLLVLVLLFDARIDIAVLCFLVLNEAKETLVNCDLQLLVIVCVLHDLVDSILEIVDVCVIVADDVPVGCNGLRNQSLPHAKIFDHKAE